MLSTSALRTDVSETGLRRGRRPTPLILWPAKNQPCYHIRMQYDSNRRAKVVTVINLKGGVGKTHTVWLLSSVCQERSLRMLVIDTDTQANLTKSFLPEPDGQPGIEALFHPASDQSAHSLIRRTRFPHIDAIPAGAALTPFDLSDASHWEKADLHLSLQDSVESLRSSYDFIVFDCPPRLSVVSYAALCASDYVVIPLEAADWGAQGIVQVTAAIHQVQAKYNPRLRLLGYLVSRFKKARAYQRSYLEQLRKHFGELAFDSVIPDLALFEKSVTDSIPITLHSPSSEEAGIARDFFTEVVGRIEKLGGSGDGGGGEDLRERGAATAGNAADSGDRRPARSPTARRRILHPAGSHSA